jgi:hypothetical protein
MPKIALLALALSGCAMNGPCRLSLVYQGDWHAPIDVYQFQPEVRCVY